MTMPNRTANYCRLDYTVSEVEVKDGKRGPWAVVQGYYTAQDREGNDLDVKIRCTAFGTIADRFAQIPEGSTVRAEFELGAWRSEKGYVNPEYVCVSVSMPWPTQEKGGLTSGGMKRGAPPPPVQDDDGDGLPFGWLILVPLLGLGAKMAEMVA